MVPPDSDRAPPTPPYSGYSLGWSAFKVRGCHPLRPAFPFQACSPTCSSSMTAALLPRPRLDAAGLGCPPFARRYSGGHCCFPFLRLLGCFGSSGSPPLKGDAVPAHGGLPHSDTHGSMAVRASPWTFAACRVLPRLREPRHPPYALARFSLSLVTRRIAAPRSLVCLFVFVSAFTFPSCQRTAHASGACLRGECGARTHDPRLAKPVL